MAGRRTRCKTWAWTIVGGCGNVVLTVGCWLRCRVSRSSGGRGFGQVRRRWLVETRGRVARCGTRCKRWARTIMGRRRSVVLTIGCWFGRRLHCGTSCSGRGCRCFGQVTGRWLVDTRSRVTGCGTWCKIGARPIVRGCRGVVLTVRCWLRCSLTCSSGGSGFRQVGRCWLIETRSWVARRRNRSKSWTGSVVGRCGGLLLAVWCWSVHRHHRA